MHIMGTWLTVTIFILGFSSLWLNGHNTKSKLLLQDLIKKYPYFHEAYIMMWNYYYKQNTMTNSFHKASN